MRVRIRRTWRLCAVSAKGPLYSGAGSVTDSISFSYSADSIFGSGAAVLVGALPPHPIVNPIPANIENIQIAFILQLRNHVVG